MPEKLLHLLHGHPLVNGMSGQRAAELVRMHSSRACNFANIAKPVFHGAYCCSPSLNRKRREQCRTRVVPCLQICHETLLGPRIKIDWTLLVTFAGDDTLSLMKINISAVETHEFSDAHAGRRQHVNNS